MGASDESPSAVKKAMTMKNQKMGSTGGSPTKLGGTTGKGLKLTGKARRHAKHKEEEENDSPSKKKESGLVSPTSISMQNTFIIMNADESFD